jgi:hypothetical protein
MKNLALEALAPNFMKYAFVDIDVPPISVTQFDMFFTQTYISFVKLKQEAESGSLKTSDNFTEFASRIEAIDIKCKKDLTLISKPPVESQFASMTFNDYKQ